MSTAAVELKNNLPSITRLQIHSQDFADVKATLDKKIRQAPMMFIGMQVIVDVSNFDKQDEPLAIDLQTLRNYLAGEGLQTVAVMSNRQSVRDAAVALGVGAMPVLERVSERQSPTPVSQPKTKPKASSESEPTATAAKSNSSRRQQTEETLEEPRKTLIDKQEKPAVGDNSQTIAHPVRSGQRIYTHGDLTVIGAVSAGAEVIADGNIHIYGALRGRAIAGARGDEKARIFCSELDAELISIAGNYKPNEDIADEYRQQSVQISLVDEKICFFRL